VLSVYQQELKCTLASLTHLTDIFFDKYKLLKIDLEKKNCDVNFDEKLLRKKEIKKEERSNYQHIVL